MAAFEPVPDTLTVLDRLEDLERSGAVIVRYRDGQGSERWISCRLRESHAWSEGPLAAVATDRTGHLTGIRLAMLNIWFRLRSEGLKDPNSVWRSSPAAAEESRDRAQGHGGAWVKDALVFAQHLINALVISCVYGWLAIAHSLVFGVTGRINLALGEIHMMAAFAAVFGIVAAADAGLAGFVGIVVPIALMAALTGGAAGYATQRWLFRTMRETPGQAPLIATVGLSIALAEGMRLLHGAKDRWPPPIFRDGWALIDTGSFSVHVLALQLAITAATLILYGLLLQGFRCSGFGRCYRACVDDAATAALMGIDINRIAGASFGLAGVCTAVAGFFVALYYGGVNFFMGFLIGFKALTAAVVGGIGVVPGAMLGGALVGFLETFWSGYLSIAYKDIAVFGLLALFLLFRPQGLLGTPVGRGD